MKNWSGCVIPQGTYAFTAENIRAYSTAFTPVGFHMNQEEAGKGLFGKTAAAGFHTCSGGLLFCCHQHAGAGNLRRRGQAAARDRPVPGVANIKWPRPVHAGDVISYRSTVTAKRLLASRPGWGMVTFLAEGHNTAGELVMSFEGRVLVQSKGAATNRVIRALLSARQLVCGGQYTCDGNNSGLRGSRARAGTKRARRYDLHDDLSQVYPDFGMRGRACCFRFCCSCSGLHFDTRTRHARRYDMQRRNSLW